MDIRRTHRGASPTIDLHLVFVFKPSQRTKPLAHVEIRSLVLFGMGTTGRGWFDVSGRAIFCSQQHIIVSNYYQASLKTRDSDIYDENGSACLISYSCPILNLWCQLDNLFGGT